MELTKEYFDQVVSGLASKRDLDGLATKRDLEGLATKQDLEALRTEFGERFATKEDIEELAAQVARGFAGLTEQLDVHKQLDEHDRDIRMLKHALELR